MKQLFAWLPNPAGYISRVAALLLAMACLRSQSYYVNGSTGVDAPSHGTTAASPWKTITYGIAHMPAQTPTTTATLYIEGNQVYSPSTNGETFPLTPAYNVSLEGTFVGHGVWPVLQVPPGQTGVLFPANQTFNRNAVTFRYLDFRGGAIAMLMGANAGQRHRPRVQDCQFHGQTFASIQLATHGATVDDPRFFQVLFDGAPTGVLLDITQPGCSLAPDIEECTFLGGTGVQFQIALSAAVGAGINLGTIRSCHFQSCLSGASLVRYLMTPSVTFHAERCRFASCDTGIALSPGIMFGTSQDTYNIESSSFYDCVQAVRLQTSNMGGNGTTTVNLNECMMSGNQIGIYQRGAYGTVLMNVSGTTFRQCGTAADLDMGGDNGSMRADFSACVVRQCGSGIRANMNTGNGSRLMVRSSMLVACSGTAVTFSGAGAGPMVLSPDYAEIESSTIADNHIGIAVGSAYYCSLTSCLLAGNATELAIAPTTPTYANWCCLQSAVLLGIGNLQIANPMLSPTTYKLGPGSPCIDAGWPGTTLAEDYEGDPRASAGTLGGTPIADIGADEYQLHGSAHPYGTAGFGPFNVFPTIAAASSSAAIGGIIDVQLSGAIMPVFGVPAAYALLTMGWSDDCGLLPVDLAVLGMPGTNLLTNVAATFPLQAVAPQGTASYAHAIPYLPPLVGLTLTYQWFALLPNPYGIVGSDGLRVTLGS